MRTYKLDKSNSIKSSNSETIHPSAITPYDTYSSPDIFPNQTLNTRPNLVKHRHNDAVLDSGTTTHTWPTDAPVLNRKIISPNQATYVCLPNGASMLQTHTGNMHIPDLPPSACLTKIYKDQTYKPLLSLGHFVDVGYIFVWK